jgi:hypothetical protein
MTRPAGVLRALGALLIAGLFATNAAAQGPAETIVPDRPGLGDGAHVVGAGVVQLEAGTSLARAGAASTVTVGESLVRIGLGGSLELRLLPGSVVFAPGESGALDPAVGLKVPLRRGDEGPRFSAVLGATLPVGSDAFTSDESTGSATLVGEFGVTNVVGVAVNVGYSFPLDDVGEGVYALIVTPGLSIASVDGLGIYGGYAGFYGDAGDVHMIEAGVAYAATSNAQLDLNWGRETDSGSWFLGFGVAVRRR